MNTPDKTQIDAWKKQFGQVFHIEFPDGKACWLSKPSRQVVGLAMSKGRINPLAIAEVIVENCFLAGDEDIKNDVGYTVGLTEKIDALIGSKTAEIKNC